MKLQDAIRRAGDGQRLSVTAAQILYRDCDLVKLGQLADAARSRQNNDQVVTFAVDRNINYTNICTSGCRFCAFWRRNGHPEAYVLDEETFSKKLEETKALGGTHILLQGGLNPDLDWGWHERCLGLIRSYGLKVHGYSPPEILFFSDRWGLSVKDVLKRLVAAGLTSIPGGGAEILVDRVRRAVSPGKASAQQWLNVMETAHGLGLRTSATMMFGHVETPQERLLHLFRIRDLQDRTGGFTAFIPWPYQPGKETLQATKVGATTYLRTLAVSRLVLDNVHHIQASWVTQGPEIGQLALFFGADDLGSTMIEENVVAAAGVTNRLSREQMVRLIETAGFRWRQRDAVYGSV